MLSLDIKLQHLVEQMYGQRRGAFVALDPRSGEVLAFVSKPTFDPNMFVDGIDVENWQQLNLSPDKPLLNRALRGTYPPGSTYKPFMALAALETNKRAPDYAVADPGYFMFGNHRFRDDKEGGHGRVNMYLSIVASCDTYYYTLANEMGVDTIYEQMHRLGFGDFTGIDILGEARGLLPSTETGAVKILKYIAVDDCGNQINPLIVEGQVHGGVVQGIAQALFEEAVYDSDGNLKTSTLAEYLVPAASDVPAITTGHTVTPSPTNQLGVKGIGEAGTIGAAPTVINAIIDALSGLGVTSMAMPASPQTVWKTIQEATRGGKK